VDERSMEAVEKRLGRNCEVASYELVETHLK